MRIKPPAIAATAVVVGWAVSCGLASADPPAPPPPEPKTTIDHDGTYAVGKDIVPGIYSSAGPAGSGACYWKRVGNDEENKGIIDNAMSKKPQVVEIEPGDKAFKTDGCQPWQKTDTAVPDPGKSPAEAKLRLGFLNGLLNH